MKIQDYPDLSVLNLYSCNKFLSLYFWVEVKGFDGSAVAESAVVAVSLSN
jgi:hypothetical protein